MASLEGTEPTLLTLRLRDVYSRAEHTSILKNFGNKNSVPSCPKAKLRGTAETQTSRDLSPANQRSVAVAADCSDWPMLSRAQSLRD